MPIYIFKCNKCNLEDEFLVKKNETKKCPKCNSDMNKKPSIFSFGFGGYLSGNKPGQS